VSVNSGLVLVPVVVPVAVSVPPKTLVKLAACDGSRVNVELIVVNVELLIGGAVTVGVNPGGRGSVVVEMTPLVVDGGAEEPGGRESEVVEEREDVRLGTGAFGAPDILSIL
jgi:hypothetical protein